MKKINTVGVVGAGTMGSALAQKFAQEGFQVILADREIKFVEKGLNGISTMLNEGIEKKVFTEEQVKNTLLNIKGTENLSDLKNCDLIVEAIFENVKAKNELFKSLSEIVPENTILATNTSSFSVTELSASVKNPQRFIGLHYFFHAAKNRLVEIIPGEKTSDETIESVKLFCVKSGKDAIICKDAYGFVVNRFFVPWLNEAVKLVEEKLATKEEIDIVCMKAFAIGMGPFALMNATGIPVAYHSEKTLEIYGKPYEVSDLLRLQTEENKPWELGDLSSFIVDKHREDIIRDRMFGIVFFVVNEILKENICTPADINQGARIGLQWKRGPIDLMKHLGDDEVNRLVMKTATHYGNKLSPKMISVSSLAMEYVLLSKKKDTAFIIIKRPQDLNALNEEIITQLDEKFRLAEQDLLIKNIVITGSGKAFVAGADISFFIKNINNKKIENIVTFTAYGQQVFQRIDNSTKKVIMLLNGLAFGGGLELALCGDVILALNNIKLAFPETGIGIFPGLGGTFRTSRRIGKGLSKYLVCAGKTLNGDEAEKIGLIDKAINMDEMLGIMTGEVSLDSYQSVAKKPSPEKYSAIEKMFNSYDSSKILADEFGDEVIATGILADLKKALLLKAPIALKVAEALIDSNADDTETLGEITSIFSTEDAYLGLCSIGKRVQFIGK